MITAKEAREKCYTPPPMTIEEVFEVTEREIKMSCRMNHRKCSFVVRDYMPWKMRRQYKKQMQKLGYCVSLYFCGCQFIQVKW